MNWLIAEGSIYPAFITSSYTPNISAIVGTKSVKRPIGFPSEPTDILGTFLPTIKLHTLKERKTKVARNIKRNTSLVVPAHYVARFKPAKEFAAQVKESKVLNDKL